MSLPDTRDLSLQVQVSFALSSLFNLVHLDTRQERVAVLLIICTTFDTTTRTHTHEDAPSTHTHTTQQVQTLNCLINCPPSGN